MHRCLLEEEVSRASRTGARRAVWCLWLLLGCGETPMKNERSHVLEKPLLVQPKAGPSVGVLPAGTRLYYDRSFPEGFDLFHVYVRVEGAGLELSPLERPGSIEPLGIDAVAPGRSGEDHRRIDLGELRAVLDAFGAERQDVAALLHSYETNEP